MIARESQLTLVIGNGAYDEDDGGEYFDDEEGYYDGDHGADDIDDFLPVDLDNIFSE